MEYAGSKSVSIGAVWIESPYPVVTLGLERILESEARVYHGVEPPVEDPPVLVVLFAEEIEGVSEGMERARKVYAGSAVLVFSMHVDLPIAQAAVRNGARGFIHAGMQPAQIVRALLVASRGELVAPRELLEQLVTQDDSSNDLSLLSPRQREVLELVAEGLSNDQIAKRLYLSESTVKQHLRSAYKNLKVKNRVEAAKLLRGEN